MPLYFRDPLADLFPLQHERSSLSQAIIIAFGAKGVEPASSRFLELVRSLQSSEIAIVPFVLEGGHQGLRALALSDVGGLAWQCRLLIVDRFTEEASSSVEHVLLAARARLQQKGSEDWVSSNKLRIRFPGPIA